MTTSHVQTIMKKLPLCKAKCTAGASLFRISAVLSYGGTKHLMLFTNLLIIPASLKDPGNLLVHGDMCRRLPNLL
jgi:hypothetical protein